MNESKVAYIANTGWRSRIQEVPAIKWTPKTVVVDDPNYGKTRMDRSSRVTAVFESRRAAEIHFKAVLSAEIAQKLKRVDECKAAIKEFVSTGRDQLQEK